MKAGDNGKASLQAAIATVALAVVTAACGAPSASRDIAGTREIVTARGELDDYMAQCTKRYGYDPEAASKLGSNVLGTGEGNPLQGQVFTFAVLLCGSNSRGQYTAIDK